MTDYERTIFCMNICPQGAYCFNEDLSAIQRFNPFFSKLRETPKRPDAYAVIEDDILLLEHFQFNNTKVTKKGSEQHKVAAKSEQEFKKKLVKDGYFFVLITVSFPDTFLRIRVFAYSNPLFFILIDFTRFVKLF